MTTKIIAGDLAVAGEVKIDNTISSLGNIILKLDKDANSSNSYFAITDDGADSVNHNDFTNNLVTVTSSGVGIRDNIVAFGSLITEGDISTSLGNITSYNGSVLTNKVASTSNLLLQIDSDSNSATGVLAVTKNGGTSTTVTNGGSTLLTLNETGDLTTLRNLYANGNGGISGELYAGSIVVGGNVDVQGQVAVGSLFSEAGVTVTGDISASRMQSSSLLTVKSSTDVLIQIDADANSNTSVFAVTKNGSGIVQNSDLLLSVIENGPVAAYNGYGPFTGSHVYPSLTDLSDHAGAVVELVEGSHLELCSTADSKKVAGILVSCIPKEEFGTSSLGEIPESMGFVCTVAAVGDSRTSNLLGVKVCDEGGALEPGDLLVTSSRAGYLKKQQDDIIRASTVAKVMQPVTFDDTGAATGVYSYVYCG
jgi:hypothetical protein